MYKVITEPHTYTSLDEEGKEHTMQTQYDIVFFDGKVENVFNEYGHSVVKSSEVFEYYSNKFNEVSK